MAFFKDMGKGMSRMGHKMAVAVGRTTETKDINFEQTRTQFKNFESSVTKVHRAAKAYQAALGAFHKAQTTLAQELLALYTEHGAQSPDEPDLSALVGRGRQLADMIDGAKDRSIGVEYDRKVIEPLDKYLKDLKEVDRRISLRGTKLVDMDRHQRKLSTTDQLKHPEEHARETSKVRQFTEEYNNINTALIHDLPVVMLQRNRVLNSVFASCFVLQNDYYTGAAQATSGFVPELGFIDINRGVDYSLLDNLTNLEGPNLASIGGGGGLASSSSSPYDSGYSSAPPASDPYAQSQPAYGAPAAGAYGAPAPAAGGYGAPAPGGYGAPAPGGAPGYGAPAPGGYGAPAPAYGAPAPAAGGYGAPAPAPAPGGYGAPRGAPPGGAGYGAPRGAAPMAPGRGAPPSRGAPPMAGRGGPPPMAGRGAPMPPPSQRRARALYAFAPEEAGELGFNAGDVINIIKADPGAEWIEGELNGQRGLLPASYVQMI